MTLIKERQNVQIIQDNYCCISCGFCYPVCPEIAISWDKSHPKVNEKICTGCGKCLEVCPSNNIRSAYEAVYKDWTSYILGPVNEVILSHSTDVVTRVRSSSGGFITQLLIDLLELDVIDGALVTVMNDEWCNPMTILAKDRASIMNAMGSKYIPTSPGLKFSEILESSDRIAFVGLPCQIMAMKRLERIMPELEDRIVVSIGLICGHVANKRLYEIIAAREVGLDSKCNSIKFRGEGWPGKMTINMEDGKKISFAYDRWIQKYFSSLLFTPLRCKLCPDSTAELADISVGDPWVKEIKDSETAGESLVIIRTNKGAEMVKHAYARGSITRQVTSSDLIIRSQKTNLFNKKISRPWIEGKLIRDRRAVDLHGLVGRPVAFENDILNVLLVRMGIMMELVIYKIGEDSFLLKAPNSIVNLYSRIIFLTRMWDRKKILVVREQ